MFGWFKKDEARALWDAVLTKMMDDDVEPDFSDRGFREYVSLRGYSIYVKELYYGQECRLDKADDGPKPSRKVRERLRAYLELKRHAYKHEQWDIKQKATGVRQ